MGFTETKSNVPSSQNPMNKRMLVLLTIEEQIRSDVHWFLLFVFIHTSIGPLPLGLLQPEIDS